ncbi:MAG: Tat pathway signal protein [Coriobacteriia bacterium]|nr:Tat pathway signal protein [Coriobacteriia bacterium]
MVTKRKNNLDKTVYDNGKILITRRHLIYGAIGVGAAAAAGAGLKFVGEKVVGGPGSQTTIDFPVNSLVKTEELKEEQAENFMKTSGDVKLPYGTLAWANNSDVITCLVPTKKPKPLANVELINNKKLDRVVVIKEAKSQKDGFDIMDARANDRGIIWTEVNILQGEWRIYCSKLNDNFDVEPKLIDKGGSAWETPTIAICDNCVYWQVLNKSGNINSFVKKMDLNNIKAIRLTEDITGNNDIDAIITSNGRMSTPIYACNDGIVVSPRADSKQIYYSMTYITNDGSKKDSATLPQSIKPLHAGYGNTGFNFSLDAIYNTGSGISNLGTYAPVTEGDYNKVKWLNFARTPSAPPCWSDNYFVIRSTMSVCVADLENLKYCILERPNASDDYGDYLASTGNCNKIVTYASIYDQPVTGEEQKYCLLRVWEHA